MHVAADHLKAELETYEKHKDELAVKDEGSCVLIQGASIAGTWSTYEDALKAGYEKFGLSGFLVKQIKKIEPIHFISRAIAPCQF
jgi:hypothetical protein